MTDGAKIMFRNVSLVIAIVIFLVFAVAEIYTFIIKPMKSDGAPEATPTPIVTRGGGTPDSKSVPESSAAFESLAIDTNYTGYFAESDKCRKTYVEMFGSSTGAVTSDSACNVTVTFNRDGSAVKLLIIKKFDPAGQAWKTVEKTERKGRVTIEESNALGAAVGGNEAFRQWNNSISVTTRNVAITARYADGNVKTPMSKVDERTTAFLSMIEAFRELDAKIAWK